MGRPALGLHFHDLRHTGNTLAAPGARLADLKAQMDHDRARAAMIYQHATVNGTCARPVIMAGAFCLTRPGH